MAIKYSYLLPSIKDECYKLSILYANGLMGQSLIEKGVSVQQITVNADDEYFISSALDNKRLDIEKLIYNSGLNITGEIPLESAPYRANTNPVSKITETAIEFNLQDKLTVSKERQETVKDDIFKYITTGICAEVLLIKVSKEYAERFTVDAAMKFKNLKQNLFYLI
jgi:hypothetical protein